MKKVFITKCLGLITAIGLAFALNGTAFAASGTVPYYSLSANGGNWTGTQYYLSNGSLAKDCFFFDGAYTYYLQADGTPMKDRLTYHPDGVHIIYFDSNGHEKFSNFQYCPSVGYTCYFDSNGYIYKDVTTFANGNTYYLNANGALQNNGWFQFANGRDYGFANSNGALMNNGWGYDPWGRKVFYHWNGMVARGLITDKTWYYNMDTTDGHYVGQFPYTEPTTTTTTTTPTTPTAPTSPTTPTTPTSPTTPTTPTAPAETYTIHYDGNGATGGTMTDGTKTKDVAYTVASCGFTRDKYQFDGWGTTPVPSSDVYKVNAKYQAGSTYTDNASVTLYARWKYISHEMSHEDYLKFNSLTSNLYVGRYLPQYGGITEAEFYTMSAEQLPAYTFNITWTTASQFTSFNMAECDDSANYQSANSTDADPVCLIIRAYLK